MNGQRARYLQDADKSAATTKTVIMLSSGDEPGVTGGVVSNRNIGPCLFEVGSTSVNIEGKPAVYLGSTTGHNGQSNSNTVGAQTVPSQVTVVVAA